MREADFAGCVRPVLVMLTTYAQRAHHLSVLWRDVVERSAGADLDMFVAVSMNWREIGRGGGGEMLSEGPRKLPE